MMSQQQSWYRAGGDMVARAGFSLAMCGALAAVAYMTHRNGAEQAASAVNTAPRTAVVLATFETSPGLLKSQAAIDASPAAAPAVAINIPIPLERVAEAVPAHRPVPLPVKRASRQVDVASAHVVKFESCLPGCDTKDPLIVAHAAKPQPPVVSPDDTDELVEEVSFPDSGPGLLGRALDAPGLVYRTGRQALTNLAAAM